jgi:hypothetical protein
MPVFYGDRILIPSPTENLWDHPLLAVYNFLFKIFAATLSLYQNCLFHPQHEVDPSHSVKGKNAFTKEV